MFKNYKLDVFAFALTVALGVSMAACSDDDPEGVNNPLSPTESKAYMEETANMFLDKFNPSDQKALSDFAQYFCDEYGDLDAPDEWGIDDGDDWAYPYSVMRTLADVCGGDIHAASRAASDIYDFNRFAGVYVAGSRYWVKESNSNDVIFKFKNNKGVDCEIKATGTGGNSSVSADDVTVIVPKKVVVTVKEGATTHAHITVESSINEGNHTAYVKVDATVANVHSVSNLDITDNLLTMTQDVELSGSLLIKGKASVTGSNMCNRSVVESFIRDEDYDKLLNLMHQANGEVDVLGRLQIKANAVEFKKVGDILDRYYDYYYYNSVENAEAACKRDVELLKGFVSAGMYYNSDVKQADLSFEPVYDSWGSSNWSWEWYINPVIVFSSDGTSYSFEDYFGNSRFASVESLWESLLNNYENLWR